MFDSLWTAARHLPVHHQLPEFTQTYVHRVGDATNRLILCRPFSSHLQSFPALGSFPMSQFFVSGSHSVGISASASVLPVNIQDGLVGFPCIQGTPCCPVKCKQGTLAETTEKEELSSQGSLSCWKRTPGLRLPDVTGISEERS